MASTARLEGHDSVLNIPFWGREGCLVNRADGKSADTRAGRTLGPKGTGGGPGAGSWGAGAGVLLR